MNIEEILKRVTKDGDTVLDIGGHVGNVAWFMTRCVGPRGKVFSFEPHPKLFQLLDSKAKKYPNLKAFNWAVSNSQTPVTLYFGVTELSSQASTICANLVTTELLGADIRSAEVPAITLDQFCAERGLYPSVIKIDVEGAEPLVLEGAKTVLETRPTLIFEMGVTKTLPDHIAKLRSRGYELYFIDIHRFVDEPASWDRIVNTETRTLRNCIILFPDSASESLVPFLSNVLAIPPGKRAQLAGLRIMSLTEAVPLFADPKKSLSKKIKRALRRVLIPRTVEDRYPELVAELRKIVNRILN